MHKRADTIGCVWLAYCINSLYSYILALLVPSYSPTWGTPRDISVSRRYSLVRRNIKMWGKMCPAHRAVGHPRWWKM